MKRSMDRGADAWFEYTLVAGRFSALPIRWQGWVAAVLLIVGPLLAMIWLTRMFQDVPNFVFVLASLAVTFSTLFPLAYVKGRPRR